MLWFERPLIAVLRREYSRSMRFAEDDAAEVMPPAPPEPCQIYVHVPFCEVLCPFCSFHRVRYDGTKSHRYFEALRREIRLYHDAGFRFGDVYVGGGTPTVDTDELLATLELVRSLSPVRSISIETNPNHLDPGVLEDYRAAGVTRLSVGVQSFDDGLLARMERLEKYGCSDRIRGAGTRPRRAARARGRPGLVLSADDRAHRALQDGAQHGPQRPAAAPPDVRTRARPSARWISAGLGLVLFA
jgi:hypothetical protein